MTDKTLIGIDMGGTKILSGRIEGSKISDTFKIDVPAKGSKEEVLEVIYAGIDKFFNEEIEGIGIGVPSVVDVEKGIVYDVQNIPSWKKVHLKDLLEDKYNVPIYINNDANCFVVGEKHFGIAKDFKNFVGLTIGTGLGGGFIINNKLYSGFNCGAGEFGTMPYLDHTYEYYASGQFFRNEYEMDGYELYKNALDGNKEALKIYNVFGEHLGKAIQAVLYAIDPEFIVLGGSVSKAFDFYKDSMWESLKTFEFKASLDRLKIEISKDPQIALLGAAALYYDAQTNN